MNEIKRKELISIITPVYNEEMAISQYYNRLSIVLENLKDNESWCSSFQQGTGKRLGY